MPPVVDTGISDTFENIAIPNHRPPEVKRQAYKGHETANSRKDFLEEAESIDCNVINMLYVMLYNQIMNLTAQYPYPDRKLPLLRASCVRTAAHTIAAVIFSDTSNFVGETKINMGLSRLFQRLRRSGGFVNKPEVQKIRNSHKWCMENL